MGTGLVSAVEWWKKNGKWTCSLICYDEGYSQIWLERDIRLSFEVHPRRYCVGYTTSLDTLESRTIALEPWKDFRPCPSKAELIRGHKCPSCYQADVVHPCLICDGTECLAESFAIKASCQKATAYVYMASFSPNQVKVGAAHNTRIPLRWIEQGANMAKNIIVGNGMEVRRFEKAIHDAVRVLPSIRTDRKVDTLWKTPNIEAEANAIAETEEEIRDRFPDFPFLDEPVHNLTETYDLPRINRKPVEIKVKNNLHVSGRILGAKGSLLLLTLGEIPHFLNLDHLIGRKIELKESDATVMQTALDLF